MTSIYTSLVMRNHSLYGLAELRRNFFVSFFFDDLFEHFTFAEKDFHQTSLRE